MTSLTCDVTVCSSSDTRQYVFSYVYLMYVSVVVFFSFFVRMGYLSGAGSDYAAFVHYLGIASMDISYTYDRV